MAMVGHLTFNCKANVARTGAPMANEPKRVSSHEKHGQGHERLVRRITARACIGLRSPHKRGAHDNGSTLQPVSGAVGASVLEDTMTVHLVALPPPIHLTGRSAIPTARTCAQGDKDTSVGVMRCVGLRTAGLRGGYALHGTHSDFGDSGACIAWDSLTHHP